MNYLVSSSIAKLLRDHDIATSFSILHQAGFDAVDFPLCSYCEHDGDPMLMPAWREWAQSVRALADEHGLIIGQVHAHWRMESTVNEDFSCDPPLEVIHRNFEVCRIWGTRRLIFHPCQRYFLLPDAADRQKVLDANVEWFSQLLPTAEKFDVELLIENLFDHKHVQQPGDQPFPCGSAEDVLYIINRIGHPLMKTCLDTGHANISGQDVAHMARLYGDKLVALHLQDNYGKIGPIYEDLHLLPTCGRIPWQDVFAALRDIGYEGTLNLEVNAELPRLPEPLRLIHLRTARELTATLNQLYG